MNSSLKPNGSPRYYYIDFLRVAAIVAMFFYHVFEVFDPKTQWLVYNVQRSNVLNEFNEWLKMFRMPLLFFVSGFISIILFRKYSAFEFTRQRLIRLIIPFVCCTLIVVPPQIYYARLLQGVEFASYWDFYLTFLSFERWPEGNFDWSHLWFIPYLFVYNLVSLPIYAGLKRLSKVTDIFNHRLLPVLLPLAVVVPMTILHVAYNNGTGLTHLIVRNCAYFPFVVLGLIFAVFPANLANIRRDRQLYLRAAFIMSVIICYVRWNGIEPGTVLKDWRLQPVSYAYYGLLQLGAYIWVYVCLGYAGRYLNHGSPLLKYANQAVYPFYILHQTVIIAVAYHVVGLDETVGMKAVYISIMAFTITVATYHLFVKPYDYVRFIFGLKPNRKTIAEPPVPERAFPQAEPAKPKGVAAPTVPV